MVDFGGLVDKGLGKIEDGWDAGKEIVGQGIDKATDVVGDGLEHVGAEGWADAVEDWGDRTGSSLGAKVGEQQLGQTEEANELIHGNVGAITASVKNLRDFQSAFDSVGQGMRGLDPSQWKGAAANAFREKFQTLPTDWLHAADAFEDAAKALETYATTVTWAQGRAKEAIALYKKGQEASKTAVDAYNKKVDAYNEARTGDKPLPQPDPFADPGGVDRGRAHEVLDDARRQRNEAADTANKAVAAALANAPAMPSATDRAKLNLADWGVGEGVEMMHLGGGVVKGVVGITNFVRAVNPLDPYNITHPAEYYKNINMTLAGLASTAAHPDRALKSAWEAAKGDPSEFLGRLVPELIGTKGAGGLKALARVKHLDDVPDGKGRGGHNDDPDGKGRECKQLTCDGDPVDMATGRMVLPQTDIALPGSFPLVFARTFESSYRAGRWFGPSWSSTVDQRLEIDSEGVVFVCEDGSLLAYPHPAPGVPVLPTHGRPWPLDRDQGNYTVTDPETGHVRHFTERDGELALLTQIDDRHGRWIAFDYDEAGAPASIVHHGGYHLKLTTTDGRVTALHLAGAARDGTDQEILRYGYTDGHLTHVTNSSGRPLRFGYDADGLITSWTDTNGSRFDYVYDDQHRCTAQAGTNGHMESRFTWDETDPATGLRMTSITDGLGNTTRYLVNDRVQVVAEIDPTGAATRYTYDRHHRLLSRTDPLGHVTRSTYDDGGRLREVVRPDGRQLYAEHNELGLPERVVHADGTVIRQTYDEHGNRTSYTDASGATTRFTYDEAGHLASVTDALGATTLLRCNDAGLPVEVTDPLNAVTRYERDAFGRPLAIADPLGAVTRFGWTVESQIAVCTEPDGARQAWTYDGEGNCLTHTDALGQTTRYEYTDFDLLVARTGPDGVRHEFQHNINLQLTRVTNPLGLTWEYEYDAAGRLVSEIDFDDRPLRYRYDAAGRLVERVNGLGQTIRFERNELGQVLRKDSEGAVTTYEYDVFDELAVAVNADATLVRLRDRYGRLKSETVNGRELAYDYDGLGRLVGRTTPSGAVSTRTYDGAGRPVELTTSGRTIAFERDAAGRELVRRIGETVSLAHRFDASGRLADQQLSGRGRNLQRRSYSYREDGHLIGVEDKLSGTRRFDLDAMGRVTAVHASGWSETYAYDAAGNQTDAAWPANHPGQEATGPRAFAGTHITRAGNVRYEHDAQGRTVLRQKTRLSHKPDTWRFTWDAEDRLASTVTPDGTVWRYLYDPLGRRIAKQRLADDGSTVLEETTFTWDGATLCEQVSHGAALPLPIALTWEHMGLRPVSQTERMLDKDAPQETVNERFYAIVTDLVGAPTELVDESGDLAWRTRSTLWGTTTWATASASYTPLRFPGQYFDPETGLHYNVHRHYDPETARYLSNDPLGLDPAPNPTTYVHNPHTWSDPLGLKPCKIRVSPVASDWATKGAHIHIPLKKGKEHEVSITVDKDGNIQGAPIRLEDGWASDKSVQQAVDAVNNDPKLRADLLAKAKSAKEHMDDHNWGNTQNRSSEMQALIDKLENWP
ncbi:putative T7SS-secreted protein [Streptomyces sp. NPDC099050]|uniref:putative T7SS-secreted protein n=1 Tax=Streptomyces sp. NPDC099050 TaxID=3366100 RepID=UPI0038199870